MPDIEGVPYEATGGKIDQATAQALAARHREAASAGVGAASAAIAPVQSQVSALSSRVDKTLADAKTYTDQKVAPLASSASVTAGDQKSLSDAKAYTDEQVGQIGPGGGVYYDKDGNEKRFIYVVSDTDPGKTRVVDGEAVEVWWVQTTPPDPMQSTPIGVTQNLAARSYTVPNDPVATYTVDGVLKPAGTYAVSTEAQTLQWVAVAKSGYGFKSGAVTSGSLAYPAKTFSSGDVIFSDSFERADGNLAGSTTDSFAGGVPLVWADHGGLTKIVGGKIAKDASQSYAWPMITLPSPMESIGADITISAIGTSNVDFMFEFRFESGQYFRLSGNSGQIIYFRADGATTYAPGLSLSPSAGDTIRLTYTDGGAITAQNITKNGPLFSTTEHTLSGAVASTRHDFRGSDPFIDSVKVFIP